MMLDAMWRPCEQEERIHNEGDDARSYAEATQTRRENTQ
jgi:hypothetical protein